MKNTELIKIIKKILKTDENLDFLLKLDEEELEILVTCIRDRIANNNNKD